MLKLNMPNIYCDGGMSPGGVSQYHLSRSIEGRLAERKREIKPSSKMKPSSIIINGITGLTSLFLVNLLPFVHIPINILTALFVFFSGILGVIILIIVSLAGFI